MTTWIILALYATGWVISYRETPTPEGRPPRYWYALTDHGRAQALELLGLNRTKNAALPKETRDA